MTSAERLLKPGQMARNRTDWRASALGATVFFLVFALLISAASYALFHNIAAIDKTNTQENLTSIGHLKAEQIQAYLDERKWDGLAFSELVGTAATQRWLANPSAGVPEGLRDTLETVRAVYQYGGVLVLDDHVRVRFSSGPFQHLSEQGQSLALSALHEQSMVTSPIYFGDPSAPDKPLLDIFVPIVNPKTATVTGVLLLRDDLQGLFALLHSWPVESQTAESLLVTKESGDAVFLNEVRHQKNTTLKLRVPLSGDAHTPAWPAIRAAQGETGLVEALDYRGKQVVAYTQPMPDTAWGLVVKIDQDETMVHVLRQQKIAILVTALFIALAGIMARLWWKRHEIERLAHEQLKQTADALRESEERFRQVAENIDEVFWVRDAIKDNILYVSPAYQSIFGVSSELLDASPLSRLEIVHPKDRERIQQAATKQSAGSYDEEYRIIRPDGTIRWIQDRAFPVHNEVGEIYRIVGISKDITGRKAAEVKIQRLTQLYAVLNQCKETIMRCTTADELFTKVCRDVVQLGGMKMVWIGLLDQQGKRVRPVASYGDGMEYLEDIRISTDANDPCGCGPTGISILESQPYWCQDFQHDRVTESWHERGARFGWGASAALPLQRNGVAVGTITVYAGEANAFDDAARNLLVEMAMDISFALDNFAREAVRMRAEAARDDALDRLQKIASRVPGLVYQYRLRPDGSSCFPFASEAIREIYRVSPEEVREDASRVFDIIHPDDAEGAVASIQESARDLTPWHHEFRVKYDDGTVRWLLGNAVPQREADGSVLWNGFITDITERIQAEDELRIAAVAFEAQEAIIITDADAKILRVNHAFHDITGYCAEEVIGNNPRMFQSGRHDNAFYQAMWTELLSTGQWSGEVWDKRKNGDIYLKAMTITAVYGERRRVTNYVAVFRDIMEREQVLEQLRSTASELENANAQIEEERAQLAARVMERTSQLLYANRAKDSFLATMSHEIRTPLGGLLGMMELLSLSRLNEEQGEMLQVARNSGESLLRIVDDILDWSKIEAHKLVLAPQAATIPEMLRNVASTYAQLASAKGILLRQQVDSKLSAAHIFDPLRLSQILNNFTSNAIKFTEQGAVEISAERVAQYDGNEEVRFCVKDSGVGIDHEHRERLFQHYEQASADTARMYGGTGLGLAICRNLAELMEGTIRVESTPGRGSTFCFTVSLPVASPAAQRDLQLRLAREDGIENQPDITPLVADSKRVSVLVVDDHPVNRMLLKHQIELLGLHVEVAAYGIVALSLWQAGHFDLIITDCHMPEMDGYELARSIRDMEQHDARQRVPIIAWTANVFVEEEGRCLAAGMDDILTKPTVLSDLRVMLSKWLAKKDIPARAIPSPEVPSIEVVQDQSSADTAVDFSLLKKIAMSHAAQVEMLQEFNFHNRSDIANLNAALKDGNPAAVARSAHRIKGASRMVGALALEGVCATIEKAAAQGDMNGARRAAGTTLGAVVEHLEVTIDRFISEQ